jgi:hypothetical protein
LHDGGSKKGLVVLCTAQNHTLAHYYRFLTYAELGDKVYFQMRKHRQLSAFDRSRLGIEKMKKNKQNKLF